MARKIVITSGKGGVGKTTVCANLAISLANKSQRVIAVDLDIGLNNLDVVLKLDHRIVFDLVDVLENRCRIKQALLQYDNLPTLFVMPSCHQNRRIITDENVKRLLSKLDTMCDYVLIDCPAGMESGFRRSVGCANESIVVTTPHLSALRDADKVVQYLSCAQLSEIYVVVNRLRGDLVSSGEMLSAFEVFSLLGKKPLGVIPEDDDVNCFSFATKQNSSPFEILADNLHYGTNKMFDCTSKYQGFWGRILAKIKRRVS